MTATPVYTSCASVCIVQPCNDAFVGRYRPLDPSSCPLDPPYRPLKPPYRPLDPPYRPLKPTYRPLEPPCRVFAVKRPPGMARPF
eukprot:6716267-Pyramimonas_sp.AAC.1